ncbi:hypothetical protein PG993_009824 [Apiospora rasikravindrae]|uniref:Uncharacterized protein n=1 Tax=Apiospora rasikravindrae TaxID=990691 RepID=A0ABR1SKH6_9PEZI
MSSATDGPSSNDRTLVIGIDFGTTYSGIAYGFTHRPDYRMSCATWPSSRTKNDGAGGKKVPTTIRYLEQHGEFEWGAQIAEATTHPDEVLRWFKLGLQNLENQPHDVRAMLAHQETDRLVKDFLTGFGEHVMYFLRERLGLATLDDFIKRSAIHTVLTVPAVWQDRAQKKTLEAFKNAGNLASLGLPELVSEPEAAATYALHTMSEGNSLEVGQSFIVLDAGGGTVDIITYTITALHPVLEVREAAAGVGDFCGGAFVDRAFADHLQATLGNEENFNNEVLGHARQAFESNVKRQFSHAAMPNQGFSIPVRGMANNSELGIRNKHLNLRAFEIHAMFEPYVLKTIRLVKDQIRTAGVPIEAVILVGGFGTSEYLQERLKKDIEVDMKIPMRFTNDPTLAVVYGAVMRGIAHVAPEKQHYGTELAAVYDEEAHRELVDKRSWDGLDGCWRVDVMRWFIRRGDRVAESRPFVHHFRQTSRVSFGRPNLVFLTIYADSKSSEAPVPRNDNVDTLCHLEADLSSIPTSRFPIQRGKDGFDYYVLSCEIEVVYKSATTEYTLVHDTHRYATCRCKSLSTVKEFGWEARGLTWYMM